MNSPTPSELADLLQSAKLRVRTGLWLMPPPLVDQTVQEAARLGLDAADARQPILETVTEGQRFLGLDELRVLEAIDALSHQTRLTECIVVYNLDLLIARVGVEGRGPLWDLLYSGLPHRPRALLIAMPREAAPLLPRENRLDAWRQDGRLAETF